MTSESVSPLPPVPQPEPSPFEASTPSLSCRISRRVLMGLAVGVAVIAAWWLARPASPPTTASGHQHGAPTTDAMRQPVVLGAEAASRIGVTYATVKAAPLGGEVRAVGLVTYDETRVKTVAPKFDGYVEQLYVAFTGESVEYGAPLLRVYSPMLVTAQEELVLAKRLADELSRAGGASGDATRDAVELMASARRRLLNWDVSEDEIARLERTGDVTRTIILRSPVRGTVVQKNVLTGQRIMAGDAVYQVADLTEVWVEGDVFEQDVPTLRLGQHVVVEVAGSLGGTRDGRIVFIAPTISPETRTAKVRVVMTNADRRLKPGMYATLRIHGSTRSNVLQVPRSALLVTGTRTLIFVREGDGRLVPREVELGQASGDRVEVRRGVRVGETVVSSATFLVDAESNLASALGGMGNMPGMDLSPPTKPGTPARPSPRPLPDANHANHNP